MRYIDIPNTDLQCSAIYFGTANLGSVIDRKTSFQLLDAFLERGGNILDTAKVYADWLRGERSSSEKTIGRWLRQRKNRDRVIVATKGAHPDLATMHVPRLSRAEITADLNASLENLQTERIDLYWLHRDDERRPVDEIMDTLLELAAQGKIGYFGCSNWRLARIQAAQAYARQRGHSGFVANQLLWNLADVDPQNLSDPTMVVISNELRRYHADTGLPAFAYSSQANGWFQRRAGSTTGRMTAGLLQMYSTPANETRFRRVQHLAAASRLTITELMLGYLLAQPFPTIPIIGSQNPEQLLDGLRAGDVQLTPDQVAYLERGEVL